MGYWNEIVARFGLSEENFAGGSKISIFDDVGALVEGHRGILSYAPDEIRIRIGKRNLVLKGQKMRIVNINRYEIYIVGRIASASGEE
jgi:sporulation protein YqfC